MYAADLLATQIYDPGHILVGDIAGQVQKIELPTGSSVADALVQYDDSPLYAYAEPDYVVQAAVIPMTRRSAACTDCTTRARPSVAWWAL